MTSDPNTLHTDGPAPGSLCWTTPRPFQPATLMLVLGCRSAAAAVVEVPLSAFSDGGEHGLQAALGQIQPTTLMALSPRRLGPPIGRVTPEQYAGVRDGLRDWMTLGTA